MFKSICRESMLSAMAKLFFIFLLCGLTSAQISSQHHSSSVSGSAVSRTSSSRGGETNHASYVSHSGAVRSGSDGQSYTHQQSIVGSTNPQSRTGSNNGLSGNDVNQLTAEGNRRRLHRIYNSNVNLGPKIPPQLYNPLSLTRPYSLPPLFGRSGQEADPNSAQNPGANVNVASRDGSAHASAQSDASASAQDPEGSRRFYFPDDYNNPFNPYLLNDNPFDPYAELNANNYLEAFGQYGNYLN